MLQFTLRLILYSCYHKQLIIKLNLHLILKPLDAQLRDRTQLSRLEVKLFN